MTKQGRTSTERMGCNASEVYPSSPAAVAASAVNGRTTDPREVLE